MDFIGSFTRQPKALIIAQPWASMIINGEKTWELRSQQSKHRGCFAIAEKGAGRLLGLANLHGCNGPHSNEYLLEHEHCHRGDRSVILSPDFRYRFTWELDNIIRFELPIAYLPKSGAVSWVNLSDDIVRAILEVTVSAQSPSLTELSKQPVGLMGSEELEEKPQKKKRSSIVKTVFRSSDVEGASAISQKDGVQDDAENDLNILTDIGLLIPVAKDGSTFNPDTCSNRGMYQVGNKGGEVKFSNYSEALDHLKSMKTACWRRPNANGNWGGVKAVDWVRTTPIKERISPKPISATTSVTTNASSTVPDELPLESYRDIGTRVIETKATRIEQYLEQTLTSGQTKIPLGELLNIAHLDHANFTRKHATDLCGQIQLMGYGVVPNPEIHGIKPRSTSFIKILRMADYDSDTVSADFYLTATLIHLSAMVSQADGLIHDRETDLTRKLLDSNSNFSLYEKASLNALFDWSLENQISYKGIWRNISKLDTDDREAIWYQLVEVAIVDQHVDPREIIVLAKIYDLLELDQTLKTTRLVAVGNAINDIEVQPDQATDYSQNNKERATDQQENVKSPEAPDLIDLRPPIAPLNEVRVKVATGIDQDKLNKHRKDNDAVRTIFTEIFDEDDETDFNNDIEDETADNLIEDDLGLESEAPSLDKKHRKLLCKLIHQDEWQRQEFESMCAKYSLLPDSAIEFINDWSFELVDAPLLEDDVVIYVDRSLNLEI